MREEPLPRGRVPALDGLRGLAAFAVLLSHTLLTANPPAAAYQGRPVPGAFWSVLAFSPLHVVWGGGEAVVVFFVLSGYVLSLPYTGAGRPDLHAYFGRRLLRLYVPVWASVALAIGTRALVPRHAVPNGSFWLDVHGVPLTARGVVRELLLMSGTGELSANPVLWSLVWEVVFSLMLPFFVTAVVFTRRRPGLLLLGLAGVSGAAEATALLPEAFHFLPMFCAGILLAFEQPRLEGLCARLDATGRPGLLWALLGAVAVTMLTARWSLTPLTMRLPLREGTVCLAITSTLALLGATGIVAITLSCEAWQRQMEKPLWQWIGQRSFSLYLVHEPIVVSVAFALGVTTDPLPVLLIGVPFAILVTAGFFRWVEAPSLRLAARVGRAGGELTRRAQVRLAGG